LRNDGRLNTEMTSVIISIEQHAESGRHGNPVGPASDVDPTPIISRAICDYYSVRDKNPDKPELDQ